MLPTNLSIVTRSLFVPVMTLACAISTYCVRAQDAPIKEFPIDVFLDSGEVEAAAGDGPPDKPQVVFSEVIAVPGAVWLRLQFELLQLSGGADGNASFLRLTALRDEATQRLDATSILHWRHTSAYFNGNAVLIELLSYPGTGVNRVVVAGGWMGLDDAGGGAGGVASICGSTDDRVPSANPAIARIHPAGCTAFLINNRDHCFLTAGHCTTTQQGVFDPNRMQIVEFNVPLSSSSGMPNFAHPDDQYPVDPVSIQFENTGSPGGDWCYFGAFGNSNTGLAPRQAQGASLMTATSMPFIDHSPLRITGYGIDNDPPGSTGGENQWSRTQQTDVGTFDALMSTFIPYDDVDTMGGNSGSPMIKENIAAVIGIHTHGGCDLPQFNTNYGQRIDHPALVSALANPQGICGTPQTIHVPADVPTIQQAINLVSNGSEIIVAPGTYFENINFLGKSIHVRSSHGPAVTIIDAQGFGTAVTCAGGETQSTILEGFTVTGGNGGGQGGGMHISNNSSPTITDCTFINNSAVWGGGVRLVTGLATESTFTNCRFIENSAGRGGGMHKGGSGVVHLIDCEFLGNTAGDQGGGLSFSGGAAPYLTATNCTFLYNVSGSIGGGVFNGGGSTNHDTTFTNCHFEGNTASSTASGGGMYISTSGTGTTLDGCTFTGNSAGYGGAIARFETIPSSATTIVGCEFKSNAAAIDGGAINTWGNVNSIPSIGTSLFCENTPNDIVGTWTNQGGNQFFANCPGQTVTHHVPADHPTIQAAIDAASDGDEVVVAPGTYFETLSLVSKTITLRSSGGPAVTVVDGQAGGFASVLWLMGNDSTIEGLTFRNGSNVNGGGMHILQANPTVIDCIFRDNLAHNGSGGGVYAQQSSAAFFDCAFVDNDSAFWGGGVMISNTGSQHVNFVDCAFQSNTSNTNGGGIVLNNTGATVSGCDFIANIAATFGGGMFNMNGSAPNITGCLFGQNSASASGGGIYTDNGLPAVGTTIFCQNTPNDIGGPWNDQGGTANCPGCPGDVNGDGAVNVADLLVVLAAWGPCSDCNNCPADIDGDCYVGLTELLIVLGNWGPCP